VNPDWRGTMPQTDFYGRDGHLARYFVGQKSKDAFVQAIRLILLTGESGSLSTPAAPRGNEAAFLNASARNTGSGR